MPQILNLKYYLGICPLQKYIRYMTSLKLYKDIPQMTSPEPHFLHVLVTNVMSEEVYSVCQCWPVNGFRPSYQAFY